MKTARSLLLVFCALAAFSAARATTAIPPTFDELVTQAELIFEGTVTDVKSQWTGEGAQRRIVSYVTLKVEEAIKGNPGATYTVRMLGGTVGDETMEVTDSPKFKVGDRDILFVENNGTQFIPLVGITHGRFRVQRDNQTGVDVLTDDHGHAVTDLARLGKDEHPAHSGKGTTQTAAAATDKALDAAGFKAAIKAKLANAAH